MPQRRRAVVDIFRRTVAVEKQAAAKDKKSAEPEAPRCLIIFGG